MRLPRIGKWTWRPSSAEELVRVGGGHGSSSSSTKTRSAGGADSGSSSPRLAAVTGRPIPSAVYRWQATRTPSSNVISSGTDLGADGHRERAARVEPAAGRRVAQVRRRARDDLERLAVGVDVRERAEQLLRVRVARRPEDASTRPSSATLPGVHDQHPVARLGDDREVVGDEDQRQPELAPKPLEQLAGSGPGP